MAETITFEAVRLSEAGYWTALAPQLIVAYLVEAGSAAEPLLLARGLAAAIRQWAAKK